MLEQEKEDLQVQVSRGRKMKALVETEGWRDLIEPYIEGRKARAVAVFKQSTTLEEFTAARTSFNSAEDLQKYVTNTIKTGEAASEQLQSKQQS